MVGMDCGLSEMQEVGGRRKSYRYSSDFSPLSSTHYFHLASIWRDERIVYSGFNFCLHQR